VRRVRLPVKRAAGVVVGGFPTQLVDVLLFGMHLMATAVELALPPLIEKTQTEVLERGARRRRCSLRPTEFVQKVLVGASSYVDASQRQFDLPGAVLRVNRRQQRAGIESQPVETDREGAAKAVGAVSR
jgi:hypothetical protein